MCQEGPAPVPLLDHPPMTQDVRMRQTCPRPRLAPLVSLLAATVLIVPSASAQPPAPPASEPVTARAAGAPQWQVEKLVDRVWVVEEARVVPAGSRYIFLSDNQFVVAVPGAAPTAGTWAEALDGLVTTAARVTSELQVLELTPERLRLRVRTPKTESEMTLGPAVRPPAPPPAPTSAAAPPPAPVVPVGAPYRCGADAFRVSFEGDKAYLTWPDGASVVLTEVRGADTTSSRRTYSDGQVRVVEDTSEAFTRVLFARPGFRPRPCTPAR